MKGIRLLCFPCEAKYDKLEHELKQLKCFEIILHPRFEQDLLTKEGLNASFSNRTADKH